MLVAWSLREDRVPHRAALAHRSAVAAAAQTRAPAQNLHVLWRAAVVRAQDRSTVGACPRTQACPRPPAAAASPPTCLMMPDDIYPEHLNFRADGPEAAGCWRMDCSAITGQFVSRQLSTMPITGLPPCAAAKIFRPSRSSPAPALSLPTGYFPSLPASSHARNMPMAKAPTFRPKYFSVQPPASNRIERNHLLAQARSVVELQSRK